MLKKQDYSLNKMEYQNFFKDIEEAVIKFKQLKDKPIRIISHLDSDGLCSASILSKAFQNENISFSLSIVKQLNEEVLKELSREDYDCYFFTDLGSGQLSLIKKYLKKQIFILDHHKPEKTKNDFTHINPHLHNIDGSTEISGSGVTYLFAKQLNQKNIEVSHLAIIGAIGDIQKIEESYLNNLILKDAIENNILEVKTGLRIFGAQTKPLHKVLEYSTDPYIPGVSGSPQAVFNFLKELGIEPKDGKEWKKLIHLSKEDMQKLVTGIILKRIGIEKTPEDVLGSIFILKNEEEGTTKDVKEFSTLLNSCGRLGNYSLGIGTCLNDKKIKQKAIANLTSYKREIVLALNWFHKNKHDSSYVSEHSGFVIINGGDKIKETLIGTLASIISKSGIYPEDTIILSLANTIDDNIKISIRICGFKPKEVDLRQILSEITSKVGCEAGGHLFAAGSLIPQEKEKEFIEHAIETLKNKVIEEVVQ